MVTREDVAKLAGVSTATVSRVMSDSIYVSKDTRDKVYKAVKQLNYIPNNLAKNLTQNKSNVVAVYWLKTSPILTIFKFWKQ